MKNKTKGAAQKDGGAVNAEDPAAAAKQIEKLGAAKDWGGNKGDESAKTKAKVKEVKEEATKDYEGSPRMGYTQNFGPARQGGYAKGAAKVNSIMKGAAQTGKWDTLKKVGRTVTRGLGDIGVQALDLLNPDPGSHASGYRSPGATSLNEKKRQKKLEMQHYDKSRELTKQGKTYFNLANIFDDTGYGEARKK